MEREKLRNSPKKGPRDGCWSCSGDLFQDQVKASMVILDDVETPISDFFAFWTAITGRDRALGEAEAPLFNENLLDSSEAPFQTNWNLQLINFLIQRLQQNPLGNTWNQLTTLLDRQPQSN